MHFFPEICLLPPRFASFCVRCRPIRKTGLSIFGWVPLLMIMSCTSPRDGIDSARRDEPADPKAEGTFSDGSGRRPRGFNLQAMFNAGSMRPFDEEDFRIIAELGFNFVRLPLDYRAWIVHGDWRRFDPAALAELDKAVAYARAHDLHLCLNLHRAPGYSVAPPAEEQSLWSDSEALDVCALHWGMLAERYREVPPASLSFNLINEPAGVDERTYLRVVNFLVSAVHARDPDRPIVVDGLEGGRRPPRIPFRVEERVFATRGYEPFRLTHYRAPWVDGSGEWDEPAWPWPRASGILYGPSRGDLHGSLRLIGPFEAGTKFTLTVGQVSDTARLRVFADAAMKLDRVFLPSDGRGEWTEVMYRPEWDVYQNLYDLELDIRLDRTAARIDIENAAGDWLLLKSVAVQTPGSAGGASLSLTDAWGRKPAEIHVREVEGRVEFLSGETWNREWLWRETVAPWLPLQRQGARLMVGEFGVHKAVPHETALAWMRDCLKNWKVAGWGWALWNLSGPFGIFDSGREDVEYEDFRGRKLDRKMLDLLQAY